MNPKQAYEQRRNAQPWRHWYKTQRWQNIRAAHLRAYPMCSRCRARGIDTPASVAHHAMPHHGDYAAFWYGQLISLCSSCHNVDEQRIEGGGRARPRLDQDGWPTTSA